jgi:hypothetical protein
VRRIALLLGLLAALPAAAHAAPATQPPLRVAAFARIGTFQVHGGTVGLARKAFGRPVTTRELRGRSCELSWPGVHLSFYTLVHDTQCRPDTPFGSARITRAWVTDRGLRQGDSVAKAKRLYPRAERPHFAGSHAIGLLVKLSQAVGDYGLAAVVDQGRVTTLVISDPQGGE